MRGLSLGLGLSLGRGKRTVFDSDALSLFARFSSQPDGPRKALINDIIKGMKSIGVWSLADALYFQAAHDAQAARLNWKINLYNLTAVSSPVFTTDRGYAGNGSSSYLDTGFNPVTATTPIFAQNSAHISAWNRTSRSGADTVIMGSATANTNHTNIIPRSSTNLFVGRVNSGPNAVSVASTESAGHFLLNRSASNAIQGYKNGASAGTSSAVSVTPPNVNIAILARAITSGSPNAFSTDQVAFSSIGGSLSAQQVADLNALVLSYLQEVGAA